LVDRLAKTAAGLNRNGEPFDAIRGLDAIAVMPVAFNELGTIINHVFIASAD
jgi:hypothetical protein